MPDLPNSAGGPNDVGDLRIDTNGVHCGNISASLDSIVVQTKRARDPYFWGRVTAIICAAILGVVMNILFHWEIALLLPVIGLVMLCDGEIISRNIYFLELSCPDAPCFFTWSRRQLFWIELFARRIEDALAMARDGVDPEFRLDRKRIFEIEEDRKTKDPAAYKRIVAEAPLYRLGRLQFRKISDGGSTGYAGDGVTLRPTTPGGPYRLLSDGADGSSIWLRSSRFVNVTYSPQRLSKIDEYLRGLTSILSIEAECFMSWGVINVNGSGSVLYLDLDNGENVQQIFLPHGSYEISVSTWTNPYYPLKVIGAFSMQNHEPTIDVWRPRAVTRANPVNANAQSN